MDDKIELEKLAKFCCNICDFNTSEKWRYNRHMSTGKHKKMTKDDKVDDAKNSTPYLCKCGKEYKYRQGLWKHQKKCTSEMSVEDSNTNIPINDVDKEQLIIMLIKQNSELIKETSEFKNFMMDQQNVMLEVIKNGTHHTTNNNNSHNKSFNLQFFLNETCKDAMNITDFIDSIKLQLSDLERVGEVGYIEGISSIIVKNLNALDVTLRPVHCTDKKRETMYIKDEDKWEKEDENKAKLHKMVKKIAIKNIHLISDFKELYPDWKKSTSKVSDQFNKIIIESMGGAGDNDFEKEEKIIKKVAKEVLIDSTFKSTFH
jgi:hypothetical protein